MTKDLEQIVERIGQLPDAELCLPTSTGGVVYADITTDNLKALASAYTKAVNVLKMANIEIVPDGHQFSPKAVAAYCGEITQKRIEKLEADLEKAKAGLEHYALKLHWSLCESHPDKGFHYALDATGNGGYDLAQQTLDEIGANK